MSREYEKEGKINGGISKNDVKHCLKYNKKKNFIKVFFMK
jgi:hypothetical protein